MQLLTNVVRQVRGRKADRRRADAHQALLRYEARLGGQLFGPVPEGTRREFFCLDEHTWVWHEERRDASGNHYAVTTRYVIRPTGIVKSQGDGQYLALSKQETQNLYSAIKLYTKHVGTELQRIASQAA